MQPALTGGYHDCHSPQSGREDRELVRNGASNEIGLRRRSCWDAANICRHRRTVFWSGIVAIIADDMCWLWTGACLIRIDRQGILGWLDGDGCWGVDDCAFSSAPVLPTRFGAARV